MEKKMDLLLKIMEGSVLLMAILATGIAWSSVGKAISFLKESPLVMLILE